MNANQLSPSLTLSSHTTNNGTSRFFCPSNTFSALPVSRFPPSRLHRVRVRAVKEEATKASSSAEEITKKYGLEAGLWKIFSAKEESKGEEGGGEKKSKGEEAKELLAKYGGAYLATSITLSLISFTLCYALITAGVDVQSLLLKLHKTGTLHFFESFIGAPSRGLIGYNLLVFQNKGMVGISPSETGEKVGTFALAYAAHKAASPIRFPPTVALTPIVASWIGKKVDEK